MYIREVKKEDWNSFLLQNNGNFLQSFEWGEFQKIMGRKVWRFQVQENGTTLAVCQIFSKQIPFLRKPYLYLPLGPCFARGLSPEKKKEIFNFLATEVEKLGEAEKAISFLIEPMDEFTIKVARGKLSNIPLRRFQPQKTLLLDLTQSEEKIFQDIYKTNRYNIKFAQKSGVQFEVKNHYLPEFFQLLKKTSQKDQFGVYQEDYYRKFFDVQSKDLQVNLCLAKFEGNIITAGILVIFNKTAIYLHGASDYNQRHLMGPHFLQWQQILFAKQQGCSVYDFWGIDEKKWPGFTYFKKRFGGYEFLYPKTQEIIWQPGWRSVYQLLRKIR